MHPASISVN